MMSSVVIVVGAARSGTKILRDTIAAAPGASCVPYDVNFLWRLGNEGAPDDALTQEHVASARVSEIRRQILRYGRGHDVLVEKTVSTGLRVPFAAAMFPDARFIFLTRDPLDVVESARRQWESKPDLRYSLRKASQYPWRVAPRYAMRHSLGALARSRGRTRRRPWGPVYPGIWEDLQALPLLEICARQWDACTYLATQGFVEAGVRPVVLTYEELCADPSGVVSAVCRELGVNVPDQSAIDQIEMGRAGIGRLTLTASEVQRVRELTQRGVHAAQTLT